MTGFLSKAKDETTPLAFDMSSTVTPSIGLGNVRPLTGELEGCGVGDGDGDGDPWRCPSVPKAASSTASAGAGRANRRSACFAATDEFDVADADAVASLGGNDEGAALQPAKRETNNTARRLRILHSQSIFKVSDKHFTIIGRLRTVVVRRIGRAERESYCSGSVTLTVCLLAQTIANVYAGHHASCWTVCLRTLLDAIAT
ncbi:MAG: hypothetical protein ABSB70_23130 [Candidatus Velthaea sp.]